jgi:putative ABC transport system substrate-binding protein
MHRILAIAVGRGPNKGSPERSTQVVKSDRVHGLRPYIVGLIEGLKERGLKPGEDFEIDYTTCEPRGFTAHVKAEIKEINPDAIFAMSTSALKAAMAATKQIPIVFPSISDPVGDGVVKSNAVPGKNATGVRAMRSQTADECLELFKATVPSLKTVYALHKPKYSPATRAVKFLRQAAGRARVKFVPVTVQSHADIEKAMTKIPTSSGKPSAGVLVLPDDLVLSAWQHITEIAREKRIPTFFPVTDWVKKEAPSALAGFGVPQRRCGEAAAAHMYKVLHGVPAQNIPVKRLGGFEWAINVELARQIGIDVPETAIKAADRVVG